MDKETQMWLAIMSIAIAVMVILLLLFSGYDLSGLEIYIVIKIN